MSWEEQYRAKQDEAEEVVTDEVESLRELTTHLEGLLKREHRRARFWRVLFNLGIILLVVLELWHYSR